MPVHVGNGGGTGAIGTGSVINNTASMINRSTANATPRLTAWGLDKHPVPAGFVPTRARFVPFYFLPLADSSWSIGLPQWFNRFSRAGLAARAPSCLTDAPPMILLPRSPMRVAAFLILTAAVAAWQSAPIQAAPIVWGSPQTVNSDSDVSTNGSLVYALTFGGTPAPSSATVNGVTFSPFTIPGGFPLPTTVTVGSVTLTESPGFLLGSNSFGTGSTPFSGLSTPYKTILESGAHANQAPKHHRLAQRADEWPGV